MLRSISLSCSSARSRGMLLSISPAMPGIRPARSSTRRPFQLNVVPTHPLLEHDQAEQQFVIVFPTSFVIIEQAVDSLRIQKVVHKRRVVAQSPVHLCIQGTVEPVVDDVRCETSLFSADDFRWEEIGAHLPMHNLPRAPSDLQSRVETLTVLDHTSVEVRHPYFETMRHRHL